MWQNSPKFIAVVELGIIKDVEKYIQEGYDINITDEYKRYATIIAASRNDLSMLKLLVNAGGKLNVTDNFGDTPLKHAEKNENIEMIDFIKARITSNDETRTQCLIL